VRGAESLANVLAKQDFDVWVGNNRGNIYGRKNVKYDAAKDSKEFFDYSFWENGKYDTQT
jgi:triacylglycerol lipase